jgi:hypothetical protein
MRILAGVQAGFTHQRSKIERYAKSGNFRASSALRKAGRVARIGGTGATTSDLSRLTRRDRDRASESQQAAERSDGDAIAVAGC